MLQARKDCESLAHAIQGDSWCIMWFLLFQGENYTHCLTIKEISCSAT